MRMVGFMVALMMIWVLIYSCDVYGQEFSDHKEIEVERLLKRLNKPSLMSIQSEDGDIIDCVPIHKQLAFDHPLLNNHTIQMRPSFIPESTSTYTNSNTKVTQVWHKNGRCPENTVSIRRIKKEDILRSNSIENFGKKMTPDILLYGSNGVHEYAVMKSQTKRYLGTKLVMNIWKPNVQFDSEFSLAQTWLESGSGDDFNTIEAGFHVYPGKYGGDHNLRLFVFWTSKNYKNGCYNLECQGFVQVSKIITVGAVVNTVSQYNGNQVEEEMVIWKDHDNWWLKIGSENVGYWPGTLFNSLRNGAEKVLWGGEVINENTGGIHTSTQMGSGHFAEEGLKKAAYFRNILIVDERNTYVEPQGLSQTVTRDNCYNLKEGPRGTSWGVNFFYGGPGRNARCP